MNTRAFNSSIIRYALILCASAGLMVSTLAVSAAEKTNPPANSSSGATNAVGKTPPVEVPLSQFVIPSSTAEGRNPFFPDSTIGKPVTKTGTEPVKAVVTLALNGISKVGNKWFALINGRTFEAGEDGDVSVGGRKVHVLCVSIRADSVTVEVEGSRQELKLKAY